MSSVSTVAPGLLAAFRSLQLPVTPEFEGAALEAFAEQLRGCGIDDVDQAVFVNDKFAQWMDERPGAPDPTLVGAVNAALAASDSVWGETFSRAYFGIHASLRENRELTAREATVLLSRLRIIALAATEGQMSSAKVAEFVRAVVPEARIDWQEIGVILQKLSIAPSLETASVHCVLQKDVVEAEAIFADAGLGEASRIVGEAGERLGFPGDLERMLLDLDGGSDQQAHIPYFQMLYFLSLVSEFYDQVPAALYEFKPRGTLMQEILEKVFGDLTAPTSNPFLNNAKGVAVLDRNWARAKKQNELLQATALADIIGGLGQLGLSAQRDLAGLLRRWVVRYVQLITVPATKLPEELEEAQLAQVVNRLGAAPSETSGILEQRFVDAYARLQHSDDDGWRPRGLGDSVNASNLSRRKLGDCDFQNASERKIVAYEAHGGTLTRIYFQSHRATLVANIGNRAEELEGIANRSEWSIKVVFVASSFNFEAPESEIIDGFEVSYEFLTISDALRTVDVREPATRTVFADLVLEPLRGPNTPDRVRQRLLDLVGPESMEPD